MTLCCPVCVQDIPIDDPWVLITQRQEPHLLCPECHIPLMLDYDDEDEGTRFWCVTQLLWNDPTYHALYLPTPVRQESL